MRASNVTPVFKRLSGGAFLLAHFDAVPADGVTCRMSLVRRGGTDVVWSAPGPRGPAVQLSPALRDECIAAVRAELAAMRAALDEAA